MIDISTGRYWDKPWSLISGCNRCSPGCASCWALAMEKRFHRGVEGKVETHPERLDVPLKRKKPTVWAIWNDLFHESVSEEFILQAFGKMVTRHNYLILTKRISRAKRFFQLCEDWDPKEWPHLWLGVTVCNQAEADEKIPILLQIPAAHRWISIEPMLGPISLVGNNTSEPSYLHELLKHDTGGIVHGKLDAVILGGETGPQSRPMLPDWVRSARDQCAASGTPFFLKGGMGKRSTYWSDEIEEWGNMTEELAACLEDGHIGTYPLWRLLDGREHNDLPWVLDLSEK